MAAPIVFTHVPKAAGASFTSAVRSVIGPAGIHVLIRDDDDISSLVSRQQAPAFVGWSHPVSGRLRVVRPDAFLRRAARPD